MGYFITHLKKHPGHLVVILIGTILASISGALAPIYLKKLIDLLTSSGDQTLFAGAIIILAWYIGIKFLNFVFVRTAFWHLTLIDAKVMSSLGKFAFNRLILHSHSFFTNNFTGSLTQKISKFYRSYEAIWDIIILQVLPLVIWTSTALYVIATYSHAVAFAVAGGLVFFFIFNFIFVKYKMRFDLAASQSQTRLTAGLSDAISNHLSIQLFSGEQYETQKVNGLFDIHIKNKIAQWTRGEVLFGVQGFVFTIVEFFVLRFAIVGWQHGLVTPGMIVLFQIYVFGLINRLYDFSNVFRRMSESFSDAQEMVNILDRPIDIQNNEYAETVAPKTGSVIFDNVSFDYHEGQNLISDFSLSIKSGEKVALVGISGAGKSTLFKLLLRLYERHGGQILIDGKPIESYTQNAVRDAVSYVPQEPSLFHRTLMENIRYGHRTATDDNVKKAAESAECDFIEKLPHGFDTLVGERGVKLSGGERQRVAIARAILKNAPILLLDEATSALDSESEQKIQKALTHLMENKTVIAIAHRLSTIKQMDRIIVIENGKIIEEGSHDVLLSNPKSVYKKLWDLQAGGFKEEYM